MILCFSGNKVTETHGNTLKKQNKLLGTKPDNHSMTQLTQENSMGTLSRLKFVVAANMNAVLEKAEEPSKMLAALIREMEDALRDASRTAESILIDKKTYEYRIKKLSIAAGEWEKNAETAVKKDQDSLAREAIKRKTAVLDEQIAIKQTIETLDLKLAQLDQNVVQLRVKLAEAKQKHIELQQSQRMQTGKSHRVSSELTRADEKIKNVIDKFDSIELRLAQVEARAEAYDYAKPVVVDAVIDPRVEEELEKLKQKMGG